MQTARAQHIALVAPKKNQKEEGVVRRQGLPTLPDHAKTSFERLRFRFDRADSRTLPEQAARQVALFLDAEALQPEERLPPLDVAARHLGIGRGGTAILFQMLARQGITNNSNGLGTIFTIGARTAARRYLLATTADLLVRQAQSLELSDDDVVAVVLATLSRQTEKDASAKTGHVTEA